MSYIITNHAPFSPVGSSGPKRTQQERDQERIERLVAAAFALFTEQGYHNTTIETLCSRANVSTRDFYKLGKTREKLMAIVYQRVTEYSESVVTQTLAEHDLSDLDTRMHAAIDAWVQAYTRDPRYARLAYLEAVGISAELEELRAHAHGTMSKLIRAEFLRAFPDNPDVSRGKLTIALVGACNELVMDWLARPQRRRKPAALREEVQRLYRVVIAGLQAG